MGKKKKKAMPPAKGMMYITAFAIKFCFKQIMSIFEFFYYIVLYFGRRNPIGTTGFLLFFCFFSMVASNALLAEELRLAMGEPVQIQGNSDQSNGTMQDQPGQEGKKPKKIKINKYQERKAIKMLMRASRYSTKAAMRRMKRKSGHSNYIPHIFF